MGQIEIEPEIDVTLSGRKVKVKLQKIPVDKLLFDEFNPRISLGRDSHLEALGKKSMSQDEIAYFLSLPPSFNDLKVSIRNNRGIMNPIWVYPRENKFVVIEGNSRLCAYLELGDEEPDNPTFKTINCYVLPHEIDEETKDFIRLTAHLNGQTEWDKYEQSKYLYQLYYDKFHPLDDLVKKTKLSRREIMESIKAYQIMEQEFSKVFPQTDRGYVHKFSYFKEYVKNKKLIGTMEEKGFNDKDFCEWVANEKFNKAQEIRGLKDIIENERTLKVFLKKDYERAREVLRDIIPEKTDKIYGLMSELTERLSQLPWKEIKEIELGGRKREIMEGLLRQLCDILDLEVDKGDNKIS